LPTLRGVDANRDWTDRRHSLHERLLVAGVDLIEGGNGCANGVLGEPAGAADTLVLAGTREEKVKYWT